MKRVIELIIIFIIIGLGFILFLGPKQVEIYDNTYLSNTRYLDLSNVKIKDNSWQEKLSEFPYLKEVNLGDNNLEKDEVDNLAKEYPNISFKVVAIIDIYGLKIKEDTKTIDLSNVLIDKNISKYLGYFPNIESVNFGNQNIDEDLQLLLINNYPNIDFNWNVKLLDKRVSNRIENLDLSKETITNKNELYKSLKLFPKLKHLEMSNNNFTNEELGKMREDFPNIKIDWTIKFGVWHINTNDIAFSVLISNFPYNRLVSEDLGFLKYCTNLEALDLGHQRITDLNVIADSLPNLKILILADNKISDLTPLKKLKHLHYLELFMNKINDISPLEDCKELVDLNICYNKISNFDALYNYPKLERLWLVRTGLSNEEYNKLKATYPNATISRYGDGSTDGGWRTHNRYYKMIDMFHKRNYMSEEFSKYD